MLKSSRSEKRAGQESKPVTEKTDLTDSELTNSEDINPVDDLRAPSSKLPWQICKCHLSLCTQSHIIHLAFESGSLTISCTVLYPEQFDALRRSYGCDLSMIESLARCVSWNAGSGKSGSAFLKTLGMIKQGSMIYSTKLDQMIALLRKSSRRQNFSQWKHLLLRTLTICHLPSQKT